MTLALYDLGGHRAALLLDDVTAGREGARDLLAATTAPGVFIAVLRAEHGGATLVRTQPLRIVERAR